MRTTLSLAGLLLASTLTAFAGEGLSAGKAFDATPRLAEANQRWPAVAAGKGCYLVVWQDGDLLWGGDADVYAARVSADGKALDPEGIPVCKAKGYQAYPSVAFDGQNFLVVWSDFRNGRDWDVYAARVSPDGKVLDPDGFAVASVPGSQAYAVAASDGRGTILVAWSDVRPQPDKPQAEVYALFATFVRGGRPTVPAGREIGRTPGSILDPAAAWTGQSYLVIAGRGGGSWRFSEPFAVSVSPEGRAQPVKVGFGYTYSLAADPATGKVLLWHNERREHGSYCCFYWSALLTGLKPAGGARVFGYQWAFAPTNDMWCAAVWDGKSFVGVIEQFEQRKNDAPPSRVELAATRVDPASGKPLDVNFWDKPEKIPDAEFRKLNAEKKAVVVVSEAGVQLRHPAMASAGGGRSLLVYSRRGGVNRFKIHGVILSNGDVSPAPASAPALSSQSRPKPAAAGPGAARSAPPATAREATASKPPPKPTPEEACRGWLSLAMSYKRAGRKEKAREYLQKIIDEHPETEYAARARKEIAGL